MKYKGYVGIARFDDDAGVIRGRVAQVRDTITFQGETVDEVRRAFRDSVDDYLEFCASLGRAPEQPATGTFVARVGPETHRRLSLLAEIEGRSLDSLVRLYLRRVARRKLGLAPEAKGGGRAATEGASRPSTSGDQ